MAVNDVTPKVNYIADGTVGKVYPIPFKLRQDSELKMYIDGALSADGFTVGGTKPDNASVTTTIDYANGVGVTFIRDAANEQQTDFTEGEAIPGQRIEDALDNCVIQIQQIAESQARSVLTGPGQTAPGGTVTQAANTLLGQDGSGNWVNRTVTETNAFLGISASVTAAAASATAAAASATTAEEQAGLADDARAAAVVAQTAAETAETNAENSAALAASSLIDLTDRSLARGWFYADPFQSDPVISGDVVISLPGSPVITIKNSARPGGGYSEVNAFYGVGSKVSQLFWSIVEVIRGNVTDGVTSTVYGTGQVTVDNYAPLTTWGAEAHPSQVGDPYVILTYYGTTSPLSVTLPTGLSLNPATLNPPADVPFLVQNTDGDYEAFDLDTPGPAPFTGPGNIIFPGHTGVYWMQPDGTTFAAGLQHDTDHDIYGGETILNSRWRIALIPLGPLQLFENGTGRNGAYMKVVSGYASASDQLKPSRAIAFQTHAWDAAYPGGARSIPTEMLFQAHHLDSTGKNIALRLYHDGYVEGSEGEAINANTGEVNDEGFFVTDFAQIAEFTKTGLYTPGTAPSYTTLTDGATITITCDTHKTFQNAKVTLGGNRTLAISGAVAGMRGTLYVTQDATGSRTLELPSGSAYETSFALSTGANKIDRLQWEYDGTVFFWTIDNDLIIEIDADAQTYITAAGIVDAAEQTAVNFFVLGLKNNSLWTKLHAIYPYMGGSAADHAVDLKNAYPITWTGGAPTHDANGVTGDGSAFYGDTGLATNTLSSINSLMLYSYCRTSAPNVGGYFIAADGGVGDRAGIKVDTSTRMAINGLNTPSLSDTLVTHSGDFSGHNSASRTSSTSQYGRSGGAENTDNATTATAGTSTTLYLFARNNSGSAVNFSNANLALQAIGDGFSTSEMDLFESLVQDLQTSLGREV